eukprot:1697684-Alexandrium_andersonii.AAC.1
MRVLPSRLRPVGGHVACHRGRLAVATSAAYRQVPLLGQDGGAHGQCSSVPRLHGVVCRAQN